MISFTVQDTQKIKDVKNLFNQKFPHLKLEFFSHGHQEGEGSNQIAYYDDDLTLKEIRENFMDDSLEIKETLKTADFEKEFYKSFGIGVQVYRKAGKIWLQTTTTDEWTLKEQEEKGIQFDRN